MRPRTLNACEPTSSFSSATAERARKVARLHLRGWRVRPPGRPIGFHPHHAAALSAAGTAGVSECTAELTPSSPPTCDVAALASMLSLLQVLPYHGGAPLSAATRCAALQALHQKAEWLVRVALAIAERLAADTDADPRRDGAATRTSPLRLPAGVALETLPPPVTSDRDGWTTCLERRTSSACETTGETLLGRLVAGCPTRHELSRQLDTVLSNLRVDVRVDEHMAPVTWALRAMVVLAELSEQLRPRWQRLLEAALARPEKAVAELAIKHARETARQLGAMVFREARFTEQRPYVDQQRTSIVAIAAALRSSGSYSKLPPPTLRDAKWDACCQPVFFENCFSPRREGPPADSAIWRVHPQLGTRGLATLPGGLAALANPLLDERVHLIVFVHGFHGNSYDLRTMRDHLALVHPHKTLLRFLCSSINEEHTSHASFEQLGANLAAEVISFMRIEKLPQSSTKVSFVCHSFGSIVSRVALSRPDLAPLRSMLQTYVSFSGPHLGMLYSSNALVESGMWMLRRWRGAQCLTELSLKDASEPTATLLYRLSKQPVLALFKHVILVSSAEDRYVPQHSACLQLCDQAVHDPRHGAVFISMVHHLVDSLVDTNLVHVEVRFSAAPSRQLMSQLDAAIGRTAHISFLDNDAFVSMFVCIFVAFFV